MVIPAIFLRKRGHILMSGDLQELEDYLEPQYIADLLGIELSEVEKCFDDLICSD